VNAQAGKALAAVGIVCGFLGIWLAALEGNGVSISYWDLDGTLGAYLLILACLCGLLLAGAAAGANTALALGAVAATLLGSYLFIPASLAFDRLDNLGAGAWFGVCTAVAVVGVAAMVGLTTATRGRTATPSTLPLGRGLAALGLVLVLIGMWLDVDDSGGSYWNSAGAGHSLGAAFLILVAVAAVGLGAGYTMGNRAADLIGAAAVFMLFGLALFVPVGSAFNDLGNLRAGAWLCFVGAVLAATGTRMSLQEAPATRTTTAPAPTT